MKTIEKVKAYCVINEVTMQQVSQFYRRKGDADRWIANSTPSIRTNSYNERYKFGVAEFVFDKYYGIR